MIQIKYRGSYFRKEIILFCLVVLFPCFRVANILAL